MVDQIMHFNTMLDLYGLVYKFPSCFYFKPFFLLTSSIVEWYFRKTPPMCDLGILFDSFLVEMFLKHGFENAWWPIILNIIRHTFEVFALKLIALTLEMIERTLRNPCLKDSFQWYIEQFMIGGSLSIMWGVVFLQLDAWVHSLSYW